MHVNYWAEFHIFTLAQISSWGTWSVSTWAIRCCVSTWNTEGSSSVRDLFACIKIQHKLQYGTKLRGTNPSCLLSRVAEQMSPTTGLWSRNKSKHWVGGGQRAGDWSLHNQRKQTLWIRQALCLDEVMMLEAQHTDKRIDTETVTHSSVSIATPNKQSSHMVTWPQPERREGTE